jgi:hypothetical protein
VLQCTLNILYIRYSGVSSLYGMSRKQDGGLCFPPPGDSHLWWCEKAYEPYPLASRNTINVSVSAGVSHLNSPITLPYCSFGWKLHPSHALEMMLLCNISLFMFLVLALAERQDLGAFGIRLVQLFHQLLFGFNCPEVTVPHYHGKRGIAIFRLEPGNARLGKALLRRGQQ